LGSWHTGDSTEKGASRERVVFLRLRQFVHDASGGLMQPFCSHSCINLASKASCETFKSEAALVAYAAVHDDEYETEHLPEAEINQ
jgi:hypothetical protein